MIKKMNKISDKKKILIILSLIFLSMLVMNFLTPLIADDFTYSFGLHDKKLETIGDIIQKQIFHYMSWGGRSVAHTIAQLFLLIGKPIFNIANSLIYCFMVYLIYLHVKNNKKENPKMLLIIHLLLWYTLPVFGQTCLWLIGSCNYMWTTVIILLFLLPFRKDNKNDTWLFIIGMFLLGIISGWTNENTSFGSLVMAIGILIIKKIENSKYKIKKWQISGVIGAVLGFLVLILAPGNFVRSEYFKDETFILIKLFKREINIMNGFMEYVFPLFVAVIILITIHLYKKKNVKKEVYVFIIASILTACAMGLSPVFPLRSWTGVIVFLIIANCILLYDIEKISNIFKYIIADLLIIFSVIYVVQYFAACKSINELRNVWKYRETVIEKAKKDKKTSVSLGKYIPDNSKNPTYDLQDIIEDPDEFPNIDIAKYYGLDEILLNK